MLGAFNILKPTGWTSSDVVVKVRHILREFSGDKKIKVGHLGTLDPAGSGVLPIVFGKTTKLFDYFVGGDKIYRATFNFGKATDTIDSYGQIVQDGSLIPIFDDIKANINQFVGKINQVPPKYSRISVNGVRACDAVRQGQDIEIKSKQVEVYDIKILSYENAVLTLDIHCSGGTYIRSICRDLAESLNTCAYMSSIIRLENKGFCIENAITLDELENDVANNIISLDSIFKNYQSVNVAGEESKKLLNGITLPARNLLGDYVVRIDGEIFGICRDSNENLEVIVRLWN